jgi:ectoine hydroxylase-related dioxygenase (phytanoyl-CoA dioxygenase family)
MSLRLSESERAEYERDGFIVRREVFGAADLREIRAAGEDLIGQLRKSAKAVKRSHGSYVFQTDLEQAITVKWESGTNVILGIEPFAHLSPAFSAFASDERFTAPVRDLIGTQDLALYTEKLNLKRAGVGGPIVLHQDWPYWAKISDDVEEIVTAMLFLDDANQANGCLEVAPGSHRLGIQPTRDEEGFFGEIKVESFDLATLTPVEVTAGSVVMFGPRLVHRSMPNTSASDRRALLYSYQSARHRHSLYFLRRRRGQDADGPQ